MTKPHEPYPPLFASKQYYSGQIGNFPVSALLREQDAPTYLRKNPGILLLYFLSDHGKIIINSQSYPIRSGMLMCLGSYHYSQLVPEPGSPFRFYCCSFDYATFLYMAANPYYEFRKLTMAADPLTAVFSGRLKIHIEQLLERITALSARHKQRGGRGEFLLCMQLIGYLQKHHKENIWVPKK